MKKIKLTESDLIRIIQKVITEQEEVLQKITEEDYTTAKAEAQKFIDNKFLNKTVNLYTHDPDSYPGHGADSEEYEDFSMGPWKITDMEFIGDLYDFYVDMEGDDEERYAAQLKLIIYFDVIPETKEEENEYHWSIGRVRKAGVIKTSWECSTGKYKGYSDDYFWNNYNTKGDIGIEAFTNAGLIKDLKSICKGDNAFTEFNDLFDGNWKLIKGGTDYGMDDEDIDLDNTRV